MEDFDKKYRMGIELLKKQEYKQSFSVFEALALDEDHSHEDRAYAYSMMGMLVECFDPDLAPGKDESGLEFYQAALALDPANVNALRGIVRSFDDGLPYIRHQNIDAFLSAYNKLMTNPTEFLEGEAEMIDNQYKVMEGMLKNQVGIWRELGPAYDKKTGEFMGTVVRLVNKVDGHKIWVSGVKMSDNEVIINNAAVAP